MAKLSLTLAENITSLTASIWFQYESLAAVTVSPLLFGFGTTPAAADLKSFVYQESDGDGGRLFLWGLIRRGGAAPGNYTPTTWADTLVIGQIPAPRIVQTGRWFHALISYDGTGTHNSTYIPAQSYYVLDGNPELWKCILNGVHRTAAPAGHPLKLTDYGGPAGNGTLPKLLSDQTATTTADTTAGDSNALHFGARPSWYENILNKGVGTPIWASMSGNTIQSGAAPIIPWEANGDLHVQPGKLNPLTPAGTVVTFHSVQDPQTTWSESTAWPIAYTGDSLLLGGLDSRIRYGDVMFYFNRALDVTSASVFSKFVSISDGVGHPQHPSAAIGTFGTPSVLLRGNHSSFPNNLGSGGKFTATGTITDFTPTPTY